MSSFGNVPPSKTPAVVQSLTANGSFVAAFLITYWVGFPRCDNFGAPSVRPVAAARFLPVYALPARLPLSAQDSVPACWLGFGWERLSLSRTHKLLLAHK